MRGGTSAHTPNYILRYVRQRADCCGIEAGQCVIASQFLLPWFAALRKWKWKLRAESKLFTRS